LITVSLTGCEYFAWTRGSSWSSG